MSKQYNFVELLTPNNEAKIKLSLNKIEKKINLNEFIKNYKISGKWTGKFFIKRLISRMFKNKFKRKCIWNNDFWSNIYVSSFESNFELEFELDNLSDKIYKNTIPSRLKDIIKYKHLINKGLDLGSPLYISAECLNYLGADIKNNGIFILDGSRRLVANILNNSSPNILLINKCN